MGTHKIVAAGPSIPHWRKWILMGGWGAGLRGGGLVGWMVLTLRDLLVPAARLEKGDRRVGGRAHATTLTD